MIFIRNETEEEEKTRLIKQNDVKIINEKKDTELKTDIKNKVYVVWSGGDDHGFYGMVLGVYSTMEKAKTSIIVTCNSYTTIEEIELDGGQP